MKIAITGGAGFVGSHLAKAYLDAGHDVLVIDSLLYGSRQGKENTRALMGDGASIRDRFLSWVKELF